MELEVEMEMEREKDNKRKMTVLIGGMPGTRDSRDTTFLLLPRKDRFLMCKIIKL